METLTRLVAESLARHGFDRPLDYRRLQWSRWFRCESHHSLLTVPSKPGVFALAEEIMSTDSTTTRGGTGSLVLPAAQRSRASVPDPTSHVEQQRLSEVEERRFSAASETPNNRALAPVLAEPRRMLAVSKFFEDDDMAFVLDRMLSQENPMRARMASGHYFVRYVVIEDATQRRSICNALNQWIVSSAERATGIGSHFASSLELMPEAENAPVATAVSAVAQAQSEAIGSAPPPALAVHEERFGAASAQPDVEERRFSAASGALSNPTQNHTRRVNSAPTLNSAVATNIHCSSSFPSGF